MSDYYHYTLRDKRSFHKKTFRTASVYATEYQGKWRRPGVKALIAWNMYQNRTQVQQLLIPKTMASYKDVFGGN